MDIVQFCSRCICNQEEALKNYTKELLRTTMKFLQNLLQNFRKYLTKLCLIEKNGNQLLDINCIGLIKLRGL
ncbi:unnamed protein product [Moneuplotes crassus]|uniref:Uncharacterized protein n=1 Tax=Euplotes crassus TaxID=5936 RepID=A0AAD1UJV6_EUPCR|nr:unnamed protein product [Moneuplotes crassus]